MMYIVVKNVTTLRSNLLTEQLINHDLTSQIVKTAI